MSYFTIQDWMVTELKLKGAERDVFAIIYGYSQDGESDYHGSLEYMAKITGYSKNSICTALKNLVNKNLVTKQEKSVGSFKYCRYATIQPTCMDTIQPTCMDTIQATCTGTIQATCINNKQDREINSIIINNNTIQKSPNTFLGSVSKKQKNSLYSQARALIHGFTTDNDLRDSLFDFFNLQLEIYKQKKKVFFINTLKSRLKKLKTFPEAEQKEIVDYAVSKGWQNFYPIPDGRNFDLAHSEEMTEDDYEDIERLTVEREKNGLRTKF